MKKQIFNFIPKNFLKITLLAVIVMITVPLADVSAKAVNHNISKGTVSYISSNHLRISLQSLAKNWKHFLHLSKTKKYNNKKIK